MINLYCSDPTDLVIGLGELFFAGTVNPIDIYVGDRRFVSKINTINISFWPKEWSGEALFRLVGYSDKGTKMTTLRNTYIEKERLKNLKKRLEYNKGFEILGMQFKMAMEKKGGCLSSLHILRNNKEVVLFIQGKIAEIPKKFMADLILIRDLIKELGLMEPRVVFQYSIIYYSIISLRAYIPIIGYNNMHAHLDLPIDKPRNYQVGTQKNIYRERKRLIKEYGKKIMNTGIERYLDYKRGEWK